VRPPHRQGRWPVRRGLAARGSWMRWPSPCEHGPSERSRKYSSIEGPSRLNRPTMTLPRRLRGLPGKLLDLPPIPGRPRRKSRFDASGSAEPQPGRFVAPIDLGAICSGLHRSLVEQGKASYPRGEMRQGHQRRPEFVPTVGVATVLPVEGVPSVPAASAERARSDELLGSHRPTRC
jgi:hypothetical protein